MTQHLLVATTRFLGNECSIKFTAVGAAMPSSGCETETRPGGTPPSPLTRVIHLSQRIESLLVKCVKAALIGSDAVIRYALPDRIEGVARTAGIVTMEPTRG